LCHPWRSRGHAWRLATGDCRDLRVADLGLDLAAAAVGVGTLIAIRWPLPVTVLMSVRVSVCQLPYHPMTPVVGVSMLPPYPT
jgi:hypothetical protein